jgi:hypothetical protein
MGIVVRTHTGTEGDRAETESDTYRPRDLETHHDLERRVPRGKYPLTIRSSAQRPPTALTQLRSMLRSELHRCAVISARINPSLRALRAQHEKHAEKPLNERNCLNSVR